LQLADFLFNSASDILLSDTPKLTIQISDIFSLSLPPRPYDQQTRLLFIRILLHLSFVQRTSANRNVYRFQSFCTSLAPDQRANFLYVFRFSAPPQPFAQRIRVLLFFYRAVCLLPTNLKAKSTIFCLEQSKSAVHLFSAPPSPFDQRTGQKKS